MLPMRRLIILKSNVWKLMCVGDLKLEVGLEWPYYDDRRDAFFNCCVCCFVYTVAHMHGCHSVLGSPSDGV